MKKTISMIALLLITIFVITGCKIKEDVSVKITENKKVSIEAIIAYDDEALDSFLSMSNTEEVSGEKVYTDEERWAYLEQSINLEEVEKNNYSYEKYEDEEFKGYKLKLPETDIDSVTTTEEIDEISFDNIAQEAKLFTKKGNEYIFNSASENSAQISGDMDSDSLKFQLTFSLPQPAKENNATEVSEDRLTYKWDLTKTNKINLVFELPEKGNNDAKVEEVKVESGEKSGETKEKVEENKNSAEPIMEIWSSASSWATDELRKALENQIKILELILQEKILQQLQLDYMK